MNTGLVDVPTAYLALNAGSSSLRFAIFRGDADGVLRAILRGRIENMNASAKFIANDVLTGSFSEKQWPSEEPLEYETALRYLLQWIDERTDGQRLAACGHRIVHGGVQHTNPTLISEGLIAELERLTPLAPLHQPQNLALVRSMTLLRPELPQIACFDTAFHHTQPRIAQLFALPKHISERGIRRYGFHGLSYEYVASVLPKLEPRAAAGRTIVAHLGSGASLCAMHACRSIATTMGLSPLDGLPMGTRSGALDPAVVFYLMRELDMHAEDVERLLYHDSGLLGVSGRSSDMRTLRQYSASDPRAAEAIALFVHHIVRQVGALASDLGGIDALIFTAGIGENDAMTRAEVLRGLSWLGFQVNKPANELSGAVDRLLTHDAGPQAWAVGTDEELMIARHTRAILAR
jgi:acetate kinase